MFGYKNTISVFFRKHGAGIKLHPYCCGMGGHFNFRRLKLTDITLIAEDGVFNIFTEIVRKPEMQTLARGVV